MTSVAGLIELARAKVNLTLEVHGRRADGYHELTSLVAFADLGDRLELRPGPEPGLTVEGPFAGRLEGTNLVETAVGLVLETWSGARAGRIRLWKELPVAAGLGGGSADAAAALRLLARANEGHAGAPPWDALAGRLGADVPVCLVSRLAHMGGLGEQVTPLPGIDPLPAVVVNPLLPLATADVFRELRAELGADAGHRKPLLRTRNDLIAAVIAGGNDLEAPAIRLCPVITEVLSALRATAGCVVARLSGSGPTCFGLFETQGAAERAHGRIMAGRGDWWVRKTALS